MEKISLTDPPSLSALVEAIPLRSVPQPSRRPRLASHLLIGVYAACSGLLYVLVVAALTSQDPFHLSSVFPFAVGAGLAVNSFRRRWQLSSSGGESPWEEEKYPLLTRFVRSTLARYGIEDVDLAVAEGDASAGPETVGLAYVVRRGDRHTLAVYRSTLDRHAHESSLLRTAAHELVHLIKDHPTFVGAAGAAFYGVLVAGVAAASAAFFGAGSLVTGLVSLLGLVGVSCYPTSRILGAGWVQRLVDARAERTADLGSLALVGVDWTLLDVLSKIASHVDVDDGLDALRSVVVKRPAGGGYLTYAEFLAALTGDGEWLNPDSSYWGLVFHHLIRPLEVQRA